MNIEMMAESKEAKKLIESSLSELKMGLGQHKLSVESVKVDVGLNSDPGQQQKNQEFGRDGNREQAKQFFQQFREDNLGRRDPFFETSAVKAYSKASPGPKALEPAHEESRTRAMATGRGERMNVVA